MYQAVYRPRLNSWQKAFCYSIRNVTSEVPSRRWGAPTAFEFRRSNKIHFSAKPMTNMGECSSQRESTIMLLHTETLAQSRSSTYCENSSAEHLFALIDLCKLIERHKKLILACADPADGPRIEDSASRYRGVRRGIRSSPLLTERDWPQLAQHCDQGIGRRGLGTLRRDARI
jgi:hypothetical protein